MKKKGITAERPETPFLVERPQGSRHLNIIIYGDSGAGKTWLAGTAQDCEATSPALLIDIDSGVSTLAGREIDVVRPRSWADIQKIYEFLLHDNTHYKSVIIDSLTEVQRKFSMGTILGEIKDGADHYNDLGATLVPTRQDWMRTGDQLRKLIRAFRDLAYLPDESRRVHVVMIMLEKYDEKRKVICPQLSGTLGNECGAFVDVLARLSRQLVTVERDGEEVQEVRRHLLLDDYINDIDVRHMGKDRSGKLGLYLWDPTMCDIVEGFCRAN
jgi:hypothetical protein